MVARYNTEEVDQSVLGSSIELPFSGKTAKSRFLKAAMTERLSSWDQHDTSKRGTPSKELIKVYEEWGKDNYGIILSGNLLVNTMDLEAPGNLILSKDSMSDEKREAFRAMVKGAKANGSLFIAQLSHAGRQVADFIQPHPSSASDIKLDDRMGMSFAKPTPMSDSKIKEMVEEFAYAAEECHKLGFDGVELHGAHGYLLSQFLASTTNKRTDKYGGSLENRSRIIFEIIEAIKARIGDKSFSIGIKINSVEFQKGGFDTNECAELCKSLEASGVDFVELSGGTYEELAFKKRDSTKDREAFFLEFADVIRPSLKKTKVYVTGGFRTGKAMVDAITGGSTDGIGLARPACAELDICKNLANGTVHSTLKSKLDENDFGITNMFAGSQISQIGRGVRILDGSNDEDVKYFQKEVGKFMETTKENAGKGIVSAGYPIIKV